MRVFVFLMALIVFLVSCDRSNDRSKELAHEVEMLKTQLQETYKPGLGELMLTIQVHHAKLWFAGINDNWKLAEFEIHEIREALENIGKFNGKRKEIQNLSMLYPALDSLDISISNRNAGQFKNSFVGLTNTCNACHRATEFEFNVVTVPDSPPYTNQNFSVSVAK
jgi:hypothetical protein